jgi:hypothetical protein
MLAWIALPVVAALAMNLVILFMDRADPARRPAPNPRLPPGWAVGSIWVLVLAALGFAGASSPAPLAVLVAAFVAWCVAYPLVVRLAPHVPPQRLNTASLVALGPVALLAHEWRQMAGLAPALAWLSIVNLVD